MEGPEKSKVLLWGGANGEERDLERSRSLIRTINFDNWCRPLVVDGAVVFSNRLIQFHAAPFAECKFCGTDVSQDTGFAALTGRYYYSVTYPEILLRHHGRYTRRWCVCVTSYNRFLIVNEFFQSRYVRETLR